MIATIAGWILAAFFAGFLVGLLSAWRWLPVVRTPVAPKPEPVTVHEPPGPEALAEQETALVIDRMKERMIDDFVERDGVSRQDAERAADEILGRLDSLGAEAF